MPFCQADGRPVEPGGDEAALVLGETLGGYLLGQNLSWHGGIHLTDQHYPQHVDQQPLRCLMDGTVIAWRLNKRYPTLSWGDKALRYSSSFCLIRHDYCSPAGAHGAQNQLRLYSLYMHLADYHHYQPVSSEQAIVRLRQRIYVRRADDPTRRLGKLGAGSVLLADSERRRLSIAERVQGRTQQRELEFVRARVQEKGPDSAHHIAVGAEVWVADSPEYVEHANQQIFSPPRALPGYLQRYQMATLRQPQPVYRTAEAWQQRDAEGRLQVGATLRIDRHLCRPVQRDGRVQSVFAAEIIHGVDGESDGPLSGQIWLSLEPGLASLQDEPPSQFDTLVASDYPIQAGEPVGFAGCYDSPTLTDLARVDTEYRLHLELFTDAEASLIQCWLDNAAEVSVDTHWACLSGDEALYCPGQQTDAAPELTALHADAGQCVPVLRHFEHEHQPWCELGATQCGPTRLETALLPEQSVSLCGPFDLARQGFRLLNGHDAGQQVVIDLQANQVPGLFSQTLRALDRDQNGVVDADELRSALQDAQSRGQLSRLLVRHDSEWGVTWRQKVEKHLQDSKARLLALPPACLSAAEQQQQQAHLHLIEMETQRIKQLAIELALFNQPLVFMHPLLVVQLLNTTKAIAELVTKEMLVVLVPELADENCDELLRYLNQFMTVFEINTPLRICHFLAQMAHESRFRPRAENLNYTSTQRIHEIFGCTGGPRAYDASTDSCERGIYTGRNDLWNHPQDYVRNPERLANLVYSGRLENGAPSSGYGYKYRARGLIQLTGRQNYRLLTEFHNRTYPNDPQDFIANPDLLCSLLKYAVESSAFYWDMRQINIYADQDNFTTVTGRINGGQNGMAERRRNLRAIKTFFGI